MRKLENVVVGVDFSQHSEDALAQALRIARHDASELHVLHVVEDLVASDLAELFDVPEDEIRGEVLRNAQTHVEKIVSAARHKTAQVSGDDGFEANIHVDVIIGNPCVEILRCVRIERLVRIRRMSRCAGSRVHSEGAGGSYASRRV